MSAARAAKEEAMELFNTSNIDDLDIFELELNGAFSLATSSSFFGAKSFLYVGGIEDNGVSVFEISDAGVMSFESSVSDDADLELSSVAALTTLSFDNQPFLFAAGLADSGINGFAALFNGQLVDTADVDDLDVPALELSGADALASFRRGNSGFVFAAGANDNGISAFEVFADGSVTNVDNVDDAENAGLELLGASAVAVAHVNLTDFVFAAGFVDDGISTFSFGFDEQLTNVAAGNVSDGGALELDGVAALATAQWNNKTFLFTAASVDDGVSVFEVSSSGALTNVDNEVDDDTVNLNGANAIIAQVIGGTIYVFVAGRDDDGVSVFGVHGDGTLEHMAKVNDLGDLELDGASGVAVQQVGLHHFLFVAGRNDDGVSAFRLDLEGLFINGTAGDDIIDTANTPDGEFLVGFLGDDIFGFGGNDMLDGSVGDDTLTGGLGKDSLEGGVGGDIFNFDLAAESVKGIGRDVILDFSSEDLIDVAGIDAKTGAGNQKFKFIGKQGFNDQKGELHFVKKAGFVIVEGDVNGDGRADFQIQVDNVAKLVAGDFVL
jgi:6-phosphogluconolactonase (cycloisomerase 2 family)